MPPTPKLPSAAELIEIQTQAAAQLGRDRAIKSALAEKARRAREAAETQTRAARVAREVDRLKRAIATQSSSAARAGADWALIVGPIQDDEDGSQITLAAWHQLEKEEKVAKTGLRFILDRKSVPGEYHPRTPATNPDEDGNEAYYSGGYDLCRLFVAWEGFPPRAR
jgi:hypothetical protein